MQLLPFVSRTSTGVHGPRSGPALQWPIVAVVAVLIAALAGPLARDASASAVVEIRVESGRADLVSGGDALLRLVVPDDASVEDLATTVDGQDVSSAFVTQADGSALGLVTALALGDNVVRAVLPDGRGAEITLTNAPQGGPVFAGSQIQPWTCNNGSPEPDCSQDPEVTYWYLPEGSGGAGFSAPVVGGSGSLEPYDPTNPPSDVATTVTDEGNEVPFIVRDEVGYSLRDQYRIAALWDPALGDWPDPTAENPGYANKLVLTHGASCNTEYHSGTAPNVLFEDALSQGFAVASHALDNAGHNCNLVTQAESLIMTKEMVAERFGPIRWTIGSGCSGGSLVQQQVANAYPGVYQGITPQCSFTDVWSSAQQYIDYVGIRSVLESPELFLVHQVTPPQWPSIIGHMNAANAITFTTAIPNSGEPTRSCPGVPAEDVYDENTNPDGVRCTLQDYQRNVFGVDENGFARRPIGSVGIQYGLSGLLSFLGENVGDATRPALTPEQFVSVNELAGGFDIDLNRTTERLPADPIAQERVYRSGLVNTGAHMDEVAIIDLGGPEPGAFHDVYRKYTMRDRLIREHGTAANQVMWEGQTPLLGDVTFVDDSIRAMDEWLAAVDADARDVPLAQKIIDARETAGINDRCVGINGIDLPLQVCDVTVDATLFSSPRIEAGGGDPVIGFTDDWLDCQTKPIEEHDYAGQSFEDVFTPDQQARLREVFPTGVCDHSKPDKGFQAAIPWLTYQDADGNVIHGGEPMGPPPASVPIGSSGAVAAEGEGRELPATGGGLVALGLIGLTVLFGTSTRRRA
ncbi:MAG: DUF6351 family protein [Nitriliruptorales bacterium]|nr:DUF6351 family protein [Nitriliruptorales bacterium]